MWLAMGKGGREGGGRGFFLRFMDGRWKALEHQEGWSVEGLEAAPTPSSAVTGMKRGGPLLALFYTCRD